MNPTPRKTDDKSQKAIDEFLEKGGKIQYYQYGEKSEKIEYTYTNGFKKKKPQE